MFVHEVVGYGNNMLRLVFALALSVAASTALAKMDAGRLHLLQGLGEGVPIADAVLTERQARNLIVADEAQRELLLRQVSVVLAHAAQRGQGRTNHHEALISSMLQVLLAMSVAQQDFPAALKIQLQMYALLNTQMDQAIPLERGWGDALREADSKIKAGRFEEAEHLLGGLEDRVRKASRASSGDGLRSRQLETQLAMMRGHLSLILWNFSKASRLYELAGDSFPDQPSLPAGQMLLASAQIAHAANEHQRALNLYRRLAALANRLIKGGSSFPEWRSLHWYAKAFQGGLLAATGDTENALRHFRDTLSRPDAVPAGLKATQERLLFAWQVRVQAVQLLPGLGDPAGAAEAIAQALRLAEELNAADRQSRDGWAALGWSQFTAAVMKGHEGLTARQAPLLAAARESAMRRVELDHGGSESMKFLIAVLSMLDHLPDETLTALDFQAFAKERVAAAQQLAQLDPDSPETRKARWEAQVSLADRQAKLGNRSDALSGALLALKIATDMAAAPSDDSGGVGVLFSSHAQVARMKSAAGDRVGAIESSESALDIAGSWVGKSPANDRAQTALWDELSSMGQYKLDAGNRNGSLTFQLKALRVSMEQHAKNEGERTWIDRVRYSSTKLGDLYREFKNPAEDIAHFARAVAFSRRLEPSSSSDQAWHYEHWYALYNWGVALAAHAEIGSALPILNEAKAYADRFIEVEASSEAALVSLWFSSREIGFALVSKGDLAGGLQQQLAALHIAEKQLQRRPDDAEWQSHKLTSQTDVQAVKSKL